MPSTKYNYNISADFPEGSIYPGKLHAEIEASAIGTTLESINTKGGNVSITFEDTLSSGDKTLLDNDTTNPAGGLIATHDNSPLIDSTDFMSVSEDENSTTSSNLQDKTVYTFTPSRDGWWILEWYTEYRSSQQLSHVHLCVQEDDASTDGPVICGEVSYSDITNNWGGWSGQHMRLLAAGVTYTYKLAYASTSNGKLASVRRSRIMLREHPNG